MFMEPVWSLGDRAASRPCVGYGFTSESQVGSSDTYLVPGAQTGVAPQSSWEVFCQVTGWASRWAGLALDD